MEKVFPVRHNSMRNTVKLVEITLFCLLITYYTRHWFPSRRQGTLLHKWNVHQDQNKLQQSIQKQQAFIFPCEYSDVTRIVDWMFVSSLEFTLPAFSNFIIDYFLYKTLHAFLQGFRFQICTNTPLSKRNFHRDHYKFQSCVYRMS